MDFTTVYAKTTKGLRKPDKRLPVKTGKILSVINKGLSVEEIYSKTKKISESDFETAINWLLDNGFIKTIIKDPFSNTDWSANQEDGVQIEEISLDTFEHFDEIKETSTSSSKKTAVLTNEKLDSSSAKKQEPLRANQQVANNSISKKARSLVRAYEKARLKAKQAAEYKEKNIALEKQQLLEKKLARKESLAKQKAGKEAQEKQKRVMNARVKVKVANLDAEKKSKAEAEDRKKKRLELKIISAAKAKETENTNAKIRLRKEKLTKIAARDKTKEEETKNKIQSDEKNRLNTIEKANKEAEERARKEIEKQAKVLEDDETKKFEEERLLTLKNEKQAAKLKISEEKAKLEAEVLAKVNEETRRRAEKYAINENKQMVKRNEKIAKDIKIAKLKQSVNLFIENTKYLVSIVIELFKNLITIASKNISYNKTNSNDKSKKPTLKRVKVKTPRSKHHPWVRLVKNIIKRLSLLMVGLILLLIIGLHFTNLRWLIKPTESIISSNIDENVSIQSIYGSFFPSPRLVLNRLSIGNTKYTNLEKVIIFPRLSNISSLIDNNSATALEIKLMSIEGFTITQDNYSKLPNWLKKQNTQQIKLDAISLNKLDISFNGLRLEDLNADVLLDNQGQFKQATVQNKNKTLSAIIKNANKNHSINLQGFNLRMPTAGKLLIDKFIAQGSIENGELKLSPITAKLYNGELNATLLFNIDNKKVAGSFKLNNMSLNSMAEDIKYNNLIDGKVMANGTYNFNTSDALKLNETLEIRTQFKIQNGRLNKVDIAQAMMRGNINGSTRFTDLSGYLKLKKQVYKFNHLVLKEKQLHAKGMLNVSKTGDLTGVINSKISVGRKVIRSQLNIAGKPESVRLIN